MLTVRMMRFEHRFFRDQSTDRTFRRKTLLVEQMLTVDILYQHKATNTKGLNKRN